MEGYKAMGDLCSGFSRLGDDSHLCFSCGEISSLVTSAAAFVANAFRSGSLSSLSRYKLERKVRNKILETKRLRKDLSEAERNLRRCEDALEHSRRRHDQEKDVSTLAVSAEMHNVLNIMCNGPLISELISRATKEGFFSDVSVRFLESSLCNSSEAKICGGGQQR